MLQPATWASNASAATPCRSPRTYARARSEVVHSPCIAASELLAQLLSQLARDLADALQRKAQLARDLGGAQRARTVREREDLARAGIGAIDDLEHATQIFARGDAALERRARRRR